MDCIEVFRQAEKEIAESGKLSLTATANLYALQKNTKKA